MAVEESLEDQGTIKMQVVSILTNVLSNRIDLFVVIFQTLIKLSYPMDGSIQQSLYIGLLSQTIL